MTYACVVVGTDGSATAERAVRQGAELAGSDGARMVVVTAFASRRRTAMELPGTDPAPSSNGGAPPDLRGVMTDRSQAEGVARRARAIACEVGVEGLVLQSDDGDPADVLLDAVRLHDADLLVVGSVGLVGAQRLVLGRVASAVLHHAPCDVLVVDTA